MLLVVVNIETIGKASSEYITCVFVFGVVIFVANHCASHSRLRAALSTGGGGDGASTEKRACTIKIPVN